MLSNSVLLFRVLHLTGAFMVVLSLGGLIVARYVGGSADALRKTAFITNGVGLVISLVAGFGLLAEVLDPPWPMWVYLKMLIWVAFGGLVFLINRSPRSASIYWWLGLALAVFATYLAKVQPF